MKKSNKIIGTSILTAIAASSCCILPLLALLTGSSSLLSTFSWLTPIRPYCIGFTILVLIYAWYQQLKPKKSADCVCPPSRSRFMESRLFLGLVTLFSIVLLALPYYSSIFYSSPSVAHSLPSTESVQTVEFDIQGMTCDACSQHIHQQISQLAGMQLIQISYPNQNAIIAFDSTQTSILTIRETVQELGYQIKEK
ncbi:mercuric transport protein MerTP [Myroides odoratus]|uniref:Mercuric transport protein MerT n=1 Tax=Myroides odoratus TaxID=256 RepID=A0A9Q7E744_MYROD|nr:mercuric transport protein MerTP [Myroides odoratus]EHQ41013.1 Heavy metal transport/detoxification protein [Myroides odoratus DSM 2801]EKB08355.1 hypothetical protein HMPREF9716_01174 [Myroides odoratus CIP 103059]QQT98471.1 mercuric transport protein MerTP [Myroides odoratus]WQD59360.1 mercuric transport protein MerTP [Myroides odoratus]STZ32047.1 Periplasmic mercury ion-binding protein [Myroides odoratus]